MTINKQSKQMPDFVSKTPSIRHKFVSKHAPYQPLVAIYLLRFALGLKNKLSTSTVEALFHEDLYDLTGLTLRKSTNEIDPGLDDDTDDLLNFRYPRARSLPTLHRHIKNRLSSSAKVIRK